MTEETLVAQDEEQEATPSSSEPTETPEEAHWTSGLPKELQDQLKTFKSPEAVFEAYIATKKMVGGRVPIPADNATEDAIREFHQKLGGPEDPEGYSIPEGLSATSLLESMRDDAYKSGVTKKAWDSMVAKFSAQDEARQKVIDGWREETVKRFSEEEMQLAARAFDEKYGSNEALKKVMEEQSLQHNPEIVGLFVDAAKTSAGPAVSTHGGQEEMTADKAELRFREILVDPDFKRGRSLDNYRFEGLFNEMMECQKVLDAAGRSRLSAFG